MAAPTPPPGFKLVQGGSSAPPPPSPYEAEAAPPIERDYRKASAAEVGGAAWDNLLPSAGKFASDTAQAIAHPVDTAENIANLGSGAINLIPGVDSVMEFGQNAGLLHKPDAAELAKVEKQKDMARGVGQMYADKYGSMEGFKQAVATDPFGVLSDLATVFTGGGAAAAKVPVLGKAAATVGKTLNPVDAVRRVATPARALVREASGVMSGGGGEALSAAYAAGKKGGKTSKRFSENIKGREDQIVVVQQGKDAIIKMRDEAHNGYLEGMKNVKAFNQPLDVNPVIDKFEELRRGTTQNGSLSASPQELKMLDDVEAALKEQAMNPLGDTAFALDALKQRISKMETWENRHTPEGRIPAVIAGKIRQTIIDGVDRQLPRGVKGYKDASAAWQKGQNQIKEAERALSLGDKASVDTAARKLQSVFRNNVNTNYGSRKKLVDKMEGNYGADDMSAALAGQSLNTYMPRGLARQVAGTVLTGGPLAALAGFANPVIAAAAVPLGMMASPRISGRVAQLAGKASNVVNPDSVLAARGLGSVSGVVEEEQGQSPNPVATASVPQPPQAGMTREQALADAQKALDAGADPVKVKERLKQYLNSLLPPVGQ